MKNINKVTVAGLQLAAVVGGFTQASVIAANEIQAPVDNQKVINQASLKSIEESWLTVPHICKAAAFNAEPVALPMEARNQVVQSIYSSFEV
jgi:hypothetical protein